MRSAYSAIKQGIKSGDLDGNIFDTGVVSRSFPDQEVYDVDADNAGTTERNCVSVVGGIFLPFFGFKLHTRLSVGTKVLLLRGVPSYILLTLPAEPPDLKSRALGRATTGEADIRDMGDDAATGHHASHRAPADMLEGEFNILNALQVGMQFLTHLVKMQAGDRAKVECFLMDDMVRIVSGSFHHMSDFGDFKIYNDNGQLNVRHNGTSYDHEAWGLLQPRDPKVKSNTGGVVPPDPVAETGRWRFNTFVGYMGDFVHTFLHDPASTLGNLAQEVAGKLHVHASNDGSLVVQSVADIVFERVTRITVPVELKKYADPDGDTPTEPSSEFLDTWKLDPNKPWEIAYHLRDYARWLNSYHAYARFLQKPKDWKVPSEAEAPAPLYSSGEKDREQAIPAADRKPRVTYSCIRILRDGSQVFLDGYGGSFMMAGGSCAISMPQDLRLEAGRNIIMVAGRSIFAKAYRNMELVAVTGALLAKARTRMALWAETGTLLLRTLMKRGAAPDSDPVAARFRDNNVGLVIDAPNADALMSCGGQMTVEGFGKDIQESQAGVVIQSGSSDVQVRTSQNKAFTVVAGVMSVRVKTFLTMATTAWRAISGFMSLGDALYVDKGRVKAQAFEAKNLRGTYITHGQKLERSKDKHTNHVNYGTVEVNTPDKPAAVTEAEKLVMRNASSDKSDAQLLHPVCNYLPSDEYGREALPQSLAQQIAVASPGEQHPGGTNFTTWDFSQTDAAAGDPDAGSDTQPWPGSGGTMSPFTSKAALHVPSSEAASSFAPAPSRVTPVPATFQRWLPM